MNILIILSPPYSFSSIVSSMLGQHPQMYAFPETHLFIANTIAEWLQYHAKMQRVLHPDGLLRALAQLHRGSQTLETVEEARNWLAARQDWPTQKVWNHLIELIQPQPQVVIEKSPITALKTQYIQRTVSCLPDARFLHLTRHPGANIKSLLRIYSPSILLPGFCMSNFIDNAATIWLKAHQNILNLTQDLPEHRRFQVRGEDILSEPDFYLERIASWLGLETDAAAILAMKHPEFSPYAFVGPEGAQLGNNIGFLQSPTLQVGKVVEPLLDDFNHQLSPHLRSSVKCLAHKIGYV
jgi:hypothetical protein